MAERDLDVFKIDEANAESQQEAAKKRDRDISDIQRILKVPEGRRLILRILSETGLFRASFSLNSMQTAFNEGKRDIGAWLLKDLDEAEPMAFSQMLREYFSELKSKKAKQEE